MNEPVAWMDGRGNLFKHPDDAERGQTMRPLFFEQPASVAFMDVPYRKWAADDNWFYNIKEKKT